MRRIKPIPGNLPLFPTESTWVAPNLSELPSWRDAKRISFDTEFKSPQLRKLGIGSRRGDKIAGYSFMLEDHRPFYVPLRHPGENVDCVQGLNYLRDNMRGFKGELLGANINVDLDLIYYEDIDLDYDNVSVQDIQIRDPLINELYFKYSFEAIAERRGTPSKDKKLLKQVALENGYDVDKSGWEGCIASLPARFIGPYGEADASGMFPIYHSQQADIIRLDLQEIVDLHSKALPVLMKMRRRGVRIDFDELTKIEEEAFKDEAEATIEIKRLTGWDIGLGNINAAARVAPALEKIGIVLPLTEDGNPSITKEFLASIDHPVARLIRSARQNNKIRTTFVSSIRRYETNGRIHTTFRQIVGASEKNEKTGAAFGRISSCHPNLQQQPSKGALAKKWRKIYLPDEGKLWCSSDFSGQELRWSVLLSKRLKLEGADEMLQRYLSNPRIDQHAETAVIAEITRDDSKTMAFAKLYGAGDVKVCKQQLKLPTRWMVRNSDGYKSYYETRKEAIEARKLLNGRCTIKEVAGVQGQGVIDRFNKGVPFFTELSRRAIKKAEETGFVRLLGGRRLNFRMNDKGEWEDVYKALNKVIQGSASSQTFMAMIAIEKEFPGLLQLAIHDEVCFSSPDIETAKKVSLLMSNVYKCAIPWRCDLEIGTTWSNQRLICCMPNCLNYADPVDKFGCSEHALIKAA